MARTILMIVTSAILVSAQPSGFCTEPADIRHLTLLEVEHWTANDLDDFFLLKKLLDLTPNRPKPGTLAAVFERKLKDHPNDARYLYLYGRSLMGKDTPKAIDQLNRATGIAPNFPWTYRALADVYISANFIDRPKVLSNMRIYRKLCPENLDGFSYLDLLTDSAETAEWARALRVLLSKASEPQEGRYWSALWGAEFRTAAKSDYDKLRPRVAEDVRRLESIPQPWSRDTIINLDTGYRLTNRSQEAARMEYLLNPDQEVRKAERAFNEETHWAAPLSPDEREAAFRELARRASEWVQKWPESRIAWSQLLISLTHKPGWSKQAMEHVGEEAIKAEAAMSPGWNPTPEKLEVARQWISYGIRPQQCITMAQETLDALALGPEERNDLYHPANFKPDINLMNRNTMMALGVIVDASLLLKDFDRADAAIAKMAKWVDENQSLESDPSTGFFRWRGLWLNSQGKLAEAEGRNLDATAFYTRAIAGGANDPDTAKHARALWDHMGGTQAAWSLAIGTSLVAKPPVPTKTPVAVANEFSPWRQGVRPLAAMRLRDITGKTWTLSDFRGRTTFVAIWATWCVPCREELPAVQKLHDLLKDRKNIQLVTLNVDDDPALIEPFLAQNAYDFLVLTSATEFVNLQNNGAVLGIPQNWIVDGDGILREKSSGFDGKISDWPAQILIKLEQVSR